MIKGAREEGEGFILSLTVLVLFTRFLTSWTIFFMNSEETNKLLKAVSITICEVFIVHHFKVSFVVLEPLLMLSYRLIFYQKDTLLLRTYYTLFPIVLTSLISSFLIFFIFPFVTRISLETIWQSSEYEIISYLCVTPILTFIERIFAIENFKFTYHHLKVFKRYLWITDIALVIYFLGFYVFETKNANGDQLFWVSKILILIFLFIFFYQSSYLNQYSRTIVQEQILESEKRHLSMLEQYNSYIENLYKGVRSFRHDYDNILISLGGSIAQGNLEAVGLVYEETLERMTATSKNTSVFDRQSFLSIKNADLEIFFNFKKTGIGRKRDSF